MRTPFPLFLAAAVLACPPAPAGSIGSAVTLELCTDQAGPLPLYPVSAPGGARKAYAEAVRGAGYRIRVHNTLGCRVGLVIAVDGRNIISGGQSWLDSGERMYILSPGETQEFTGWRTAQDKVNRFYFTTVEDSYAAAFGDTSAMGVVAMAVYPEKPTPPPPPSPPPGIRRFRCEDSTGAAAAPEMSRQSRKFEGKSAPGTGYGEEVYSPSFTVEFDPETVAREKCLIKYEWRETLLRTGILRGPSVPRNRLWDGGYCPPPPRS